MCSPSLLSIRVVERLVGMLRKQAVSLLGAIENMSLSQMSPPRVNDLCTRLQIPLLCSIPFLPDLEACIGLPMQLLASRFAEIIEQTVSSPTFCGPNVMTEKEDATQKVT